MPFRFDGDVIHVYLTINNTEERGLFSEDRAALLPLPGKRFDVVTWRHMKADRYGVAAPGDGIAVPRTGRTRAER